MATSSPAENWTKFFKDAGIPDGLAANYAVMFSDHRITKGILGDLTREILNEMGIKAIGDTISILKQAKSVSEQVNREKTSKLLNTSNRSPNPKPDSSSRMISTKPKSSSKAITPESKAEEIAVSDEESRRDVFARLGQESPTSSKANVFGRLGDPVPGDSPKEELEYTRVLKSTPSPKQGTKRVSPLDRLGPAKKEQKKQAVIMSSSPSEAIVSPSKTVVVKKVGKVYVKKHVLERLGQENAKTVTFEEDHTVRVKSPKKKKTVVRVRSSSFSGDSALPKATITRIIPGHEKTTTSGVLKRLGAKVTSSTAPGVKKAAVQRVGLDVHASSPQPKKGKVPRLRVTSSQGTKSPTAKPISSNQVTSTTSAGIFRGGALSVENKSVFNRLGRK